MNRVKGKNAKVFMSKTFIREALLVHLGLGLASLLEIVNLSVDTVSTLGNESLVVIAAQEDINGQTVLVRRLAFRVDGVDGVGVGDGDDDRLDDDVIGRFDLLAGNHVGGGTAVGHVIEDNIVMVVVVVLTVIITSTINRLVVGMLMMVVMIMVAVMVIMVTVVVLTRA